MVFLLIWSLVVYSPVVHWIWHPGGWLAKLGAQDWAGGIVVHTSAGAAVLGILLVVGRRRDWPQTAALPSSVPLAMLGAGILWFGWFGFNGGDGLQANGVAAQAVLNTHIAAAAGMLGLAPAGAPARRPRHRDRRCLRRRRRPGDGHTLRRLRQHPRPPSPSA